MADNNDLNTADAENIEKRVEAKKKALLYEIVVIGILMYPVFEYVRNGRIAVVDIIFTVVMLIAGIGFVSRITRRADKPIKKSEMPAIPPVSEKSN